MTSFSSTVVLRKRKRGPDTGFVLHLSSSSSPENDLTSSSESDFELEREPLEPAASTSSLVTVSKRKKRYSCTFEGCDKAYSKPSRLAEHERSHTGDVRLRFIIRQFKRLILYIASIYLCNMR